MAEALLRQLAPENFIVASAGTHPRKPHPLALKALAAAGLKTSDLQSSKLSAVDQQDWDYVIALCDQAADECQRLCPTAQHLTWDSPDPATRDELVVFMSSLNAIRERIMDFIRVHQRNAPRPSLHPLSLFKTLADSSRLQLLQLIHRQQPVCVQELTAALQVSQPKVSRHLALLREAGLVEAHKQGQRVYYRQASQLDTWAQDLIHLTLQALPPESR